MSYKKRPKNKHELSSKSGKRVRKELPKKDIVEFRFIYKDEEYSNKLGNGRLKIMADGGISCLVQEDDKWIPVRAKLIHIKLKTIIIKKDKKK